ncbi:MAG: alanyl-tRNA editing protein [Acidobacteria bacterium]|nr:alanyl-tRNA editing protein [Acidobacteriota bacterium]MCB9396340.1 alanyl-tRNA editing protein [Acidobacteriota bacterium]
MLTERLHLNDSYLEHFEAQLVALSTWQYQPSLILDRTAFYAESGGQLGDRGQLETPLGPILISDTQIDETGQVHHLVQTVAANLADAVGTKVNGLVEHEKRRDMMSQHTGQHILSAALDELFNAATVSSRLGSSSSTIDVEKAEFSQADKRKVEERVNQVIMDSRPVRIHYPSPSELAKFPLRKMPTVSEAIRLIEIEGFDTTPCGGTHCKDSGGVGPLLITGWEKYKGLTRIHFQAGTRLLNRIGEREGVLDQLASFFGVGWQEVPDHVQRQKVQIQNLSQQLGSMRSDLVNLKLAQLLPDLQPKSDTPHIIRVESPDPVAFRAMAQRMAEAGYFILLLAEMDGKLRFILEGPDPSLVAAYHRETLVPLGAKGGGKTRIEGVLPQNSGSQTLLKQALNF